MDFAALISPASVANVGEATPQGASSKGAASVHEAGDAFAGVFAEMVGKGVGGGTVHDAGAIASTTPLAGATVVPAISSLPKTVPVIARDPKTAAVPTKAERSTSIVPTAKATVAAPPPDAPAPSSEVPTIAKDAVERSVASETPEEPVGQTSGAKPPKATKAGGRARKVESPPDPPPTQATLEKGAPTKAPNAPVERPDPNSKDATDKGAGKTDPAEADEASARASQLAVGLPPTAPKGSATPKASPSASAIQGAAVSKIASAVTDAPESEGETAVGLAPEPGAPTDVPAIAPDPATAIPTQTSSAPMSSAPAALRLAAAPDLGAIPQVETAPAAHVATEATANAVTVGASTVPNARVAKVASEAAAPKVATATTKAAATKTETPSFGDELSAASLTEADTASGDDGAPSDDTPQQNLPQAPSQGATTARTAATERPEAGTNRPSVDRHVVVRQVADRIENMVASRPKEGVTVHLEPRDLGTVTLVVKGLRSALDVQVTASDDRVRQSLNSSRPELTQALAPRGIELRELRVAPAPTGSSTNSTSGGANSNGGNANPEGRARSQSSAPTFAKASRGESDSPRTVRSRSAGRGVDLLV